MTMSNPHELPTRIQLPSTSATERGKRVEEQEIAPPETNQGKTFTENRPARAASL